MNRVAAGSVSERYQTSFCAQFLKHLFENVKFVFDLFCEIINFQKAASKFTRYGVNFRRENVFAVSEVGRKPGNDPKNKNEERHFPDIKKTHQFQSIKSNKEVTPKSRETYFFYRKPQKLKFLRNVFRKLSSKGFSSRGKLHSAENTKSVKPLQK